MGEQGQTWRGIQPRTGHSPLCNTCCEAAAAAIRSGRPGRVLRPGVVPCARPAGTRPGQSPGLLAWCAL